MTANSVHLALAIFSPEVFDVVDRKSINFQHVSIFRKILVATDSYNQIMSVEDNLIFLWL